MTKPAAKPKTVGKDFSVLKPEERIAMEVFAIYQVVFKGEKERAFQPRAKTVMRRVWDAGKLNMRQQRAWKKFLDDHDKAEGRSGGVVSAYGDYIQKGDNEFREPTAYENVYRRRIVQICSGLSRREYALLKDLVQDELKATGNIQLELIGLMRSGYADKNSARVAGVVHIHNLMDRLADEYNF